MLYIVLIKQKMKLLSQEPIQKGNGIYHCFSLSANKHTMASNIILKLRKTRQNLNQSLCVKNLKYGIFVNNSLKTTRAFLSK